MTICIPVSSSLRAYLALKQSGAQLATAPSLAPWRELLLTGAGGGDSSTAAADAAAAAAASLLLAQFSIGEVRLEALPAALQDASADILAAPLDYSVLAVNPFQVCGEGAHVAVNAVGFYAFVCLAAFPAFSFFFVRLALLRRMGDPAVVGVPTAEQWNSGGLRAHFLPLPPLLERLVGDPCSAPALKKGGAATTTCATATTSGRRPSPTAAAAADSSNPPLTEHEKKEVEELNLAYTLSPLVVRSALASLREAASLRSAKLAWEESRRLSREAAALLDKTPTAYDHASAPLIKPWTVGERLPSGFFFKQLDQVVLYLLTIPAAYNAARTAGASSLPYAQAATLNAFLLLAVVALMGLSACAAMRFSLFRDFDLWKRNALVAVCALTALSGVINFVGWLKEEGSATGLDGLLLGLTAALFSLTVVLMAYLLRGFFAALEHSSKAEGQLAAEVEALKAMGKELQQGGALSPGSPLRRSRRGWGGGGGGGGGDSPARRPPIGRGRAEPPLAAAPLPSVHLRSPQAAAQTPTARHGGSDLEAPSQMPGDSERA